MLIKYLSSLMMMVKKKESIRLRMSNVTLLMTRWSVLVEKVVVLETLKMGKFMK